MCSLFSTIPDIHTHLHTCSLISSSLHTLHLPFCLLTDCLLCYLSCSALLLFSLFSLLPACSGCVLTAYSTAVNRPLSKLTLRVYLKCLCQSATRLTLRCRTIWFLPRVMYLLFPLCSNFSVSLLSTYFNRLRLLPISDFLVQSCIALS